jgi:hypothetical protein
MTKSSPQQIVASNGWRVEQWAPSDSDAGGFRGFSVVHRRYLHCGGYPHVPPPKYVPAVCADGGGDPWRGVSSDPNSRVAGGFRVVGELRGRPTMLVLEAVQGVRRLSLDMTCRGAGLFDVGPLDGPQSSAAQIADGATREMTNRIVQQFCARVMLDVPSGSKSDQHLTITLPELPRDLTPPSNLRTISHNALDLCALLER